MYLALYRKYRPRTFDDVISQEHITTTLKNQIAGGCAGHAYLFTGSRGTGKTSCAKIFAMAVNCLDPKDGNPCLECERCREILDSTATDIVEMDAASNNGVDDVRQLRDEVAYTPVSCKYRVYIIDEVHMLSTPAFNALLKTLEEPPPHVKFILATTELHKVPATISSRCQRFEFRRVDAADSAKRLLEVAEKENFRLDSDAAELIARLSDGGMRDALSVLDRCISAEDHVTVGVVRDCAGVADRKHLAAFSEMTANHDTAGCIRLLGELHKGSKDISLIIDELSGYYRDMMLCKTAPNDRDLLSVLPDEQEELFRIAKTYSLEDILRCLALLQQCADDIGKVRQRKTLAEMCFVKMCTGADVRVENARSPKTASAGTVQFREIPSEPVNFTPKSDEQLSTAEKVNASRTRALLEETARLAGASAAAKEQVSPAKEQTAPTKEQVLPTKEQAAPANEKVPIQKGTASSEAPAMYAPPFEEPPPISDEYAPPDNGFYSDSYPIKSSDDVPPEPMKSAPEPNGDVLRKKSEDKSENSENAGNVVITAGQWKDAVSQTSYMTALLLEGSTANIENGVLVIRSSNEMLLKNVKGDEIRRYEKEISNALGFSVHIKIMPMKTDPNEDQADKTPLEKMLSKAKELGVSVNIKD